MDYHDATDTDYLTELSALYEISSIPTSLISYEELGRLVLDKATRLLGTSMALLYRREDDGQPLRFWAARGVPVAEVEKLPPRGEAMARALDEGQPVTLEGVKAVRALGVLPAHYPVLQGLCLPIRAGASVRALLCAFRLTDRPFTRTDLSLFNMLAGRAGTALESIRLFAELERRNRELQQEIAERKRAEEALRRAHDGLEIQVQERTAKLAKANEALRAEITERKQAEEALAEERNLLHTLIDHLPDYIYVKNTEGRFVIGNMAVVRQMGFTSLDKLVGKSDFDLFPEELAAQYYVAEQEIIQSGQGLYDYEGPTVDTSKGEENRWVSTTKVPFRDAQGKIAGFVGLGRDITERKRAEEALEKAYQEVEKQVEERTAELKREITERKRAERLLQALNQAALAMGRVLTPEEMFAAVAEELKKLGFACAIYLTDESRKRLFPKYFSYDAKVLQAAEKLVGLTAKDVSISVEDAEVYRKVVWDRETFFVENPANVIRQWLPKLAKGLAGQIVRMLRVPKTIAAPLITEDEVIGVLSVQSNNLTEEDIPAITAFAHQMAAAWRKAQLMQDVQRSLTELKQAGEALRASEERFALAVQGSNDGIWDWNIQNNSLYWSPRLKELLGYADDELDVDFDTFESLLHPDDRGHTRAAIEAHLKNGGLYDVEQQLRTQSGEYRWFRARGQALWDEAGNPIRMAGSTTDITERKQAEERVLRQSAVLDAINKVFRETLTCETDEEVARTCLAVAEELTSSQFGWIGEVNPAGRMDAIALSDPGWEACRMPRSDAAVLIKDMEIRGIWSRALKYEQSLIVNDPASHPDRVGTPKGHPPLTSFLGVPLKHAGRTIGMIALANKVSGYDLADQQAVETLSVAFVEALNRKRAEEALARERNLLRTIINNLPDYIYVKDTESRYFVSNAAHVHFLGATKLEEVAGKSVFELFPQELAAQYYADDQEVIRSGQPLLKREERSVDQAGNSVWLLTTKVPLRDSDGEIVGLVGIARDITERKQAEEERERLLAELGAKNRELDSFVYTVSHDLRSPLVSLQGFSTRLREGYSDQLDERGRLYVERIQANTEHMGELLSNLLELSRIGRVAGLVEAVPLGEVVDRLIQEWEPRLEEQGIELEIAPDLPTVQGDRRRLEQVMANLLGNAVKFMGPQPQPRVEVGWRDEGEAYVIYVRDNGIGIDPQYHKKIFEIFQRLGEVEAEGTGVGLAIVKRIVEHHGGRVWVESERGQGATFYFSLPRIVEREAGSV